MPFVCPCAESMTSASTPASTKAFALSNPPTPIAAATLSLPSSSLFAFGYSFFFFRSFIVIKPTSLLLSSTIGSFSTLFPAKILAASSSVQPFGAVISGIFVITSPTFLSKAFSKRKSRFVRIPSKVLFSSTTGTPEMWYSPIMSSAWLTLSSGRTKTGSKIIPLSLFFTLFICFTWLSISIFLWITPIPPRRAIAIAARVSVTVSIAADTSGIFRLMFFVNFVVISTSFGSTSEYCGTKSTSSKVRARFSIFIVCPFFLNSTF